MRPAIAIVYKIEFVFRIFIHMTMMTKFLSLRRVGDSVGSNLLSSWVQSFGILEGSGPGGFEVRFW